MPRYMIPRCAHCEGGALLMVARNDGDGLAAFVAGLPQGQRHNGFYWAAKTAIEDDLPPVEVSKVAKAGVEAGLDESYVKRTLAEVQERSGL